MSGLSKIEWLCRAVQILPHTLVGSEPTLLHNERCESSSHGIAFFRRVEVVKAIVAAAKLFGRMAQTGRVGKRVFKHACNLRQSINRK